MRGSITADQHRAQCDLVRATLQRSTEPHWQEFLSHWQTA
jgi:hypothetical protein